MNDEILKLVDVLKRKVTCPEQIAEIEASLDAIFITAKGSINYYAIIYLEEIGFKHTVVEKDLFGPLRCKLTSPLGQSFYYG